MREGYLREEGGRVIKGVPLMGLECHTDLH